MSYRLYWQALDSLCSQSLPTKADRVSMAVLERYLETHDYSACDLLDIGCGDGRLSIIAAKEVFSRVLLSDIVEASSIAKARLNRISPSTEVIVLDNNVTLENWMELRSGIIVCAGVLSLYDEPTQKILIKKLAEKTPVGIFLVVPAYNFVGRLYVFINLARGTLTSFIVRTILSAIVSMSGFLRHIFILRKASVHFIHLLEPFIPKQIYRLTLDGYISALRDEGYALLYDSDSGFGTNLIFVRSPNESVISCSDNN
jgi:hypothetical protein